MDENLGLFHHGPVTAFLIKKLIIATALNDIQDESLVTQGFIFKFLKAPNSLKASLYQVRFDKEQVRYES
jgi:hypothetical protein